jgi:hypothetical protein
MAGAIYITGTLQGLPQGSVNVAVPAIIPSSSNLYAETTIVLAPGNNVISVPTWAVGCIITPPAANTVQLLLKAVIGDAGLTLALTGAQLLNFGPAPPGSFVLNAASPTTGSTSIAFF